MDNSLNLVCENISVVTIQINDFLKKADKGKLQKLFQQHFKRQDIIPFFGSGFTCGFPATRELVPSVDELKTEMIDIIAAIEKYSKSDRNVLATMARRENEAVSG